MNERRRYNWRSFAGATMATHSVPFAILAAIVYTSCR
jgi:hypothetical protein